MIRTLDQLIAAILIATLILLILGWVWVWATTRPERSYRRRRRFEARRKLAEAAKRGMMGSNWRIK